MMASSESGGSGSSGGCRVRSVKLVRRAPPAKLGFSVRGGREHGTGFFVTSVEPQSEAHCAGLRAGDQIVRVNGYPVDDATHGELLQLIQGHTSLVLRVRTVGMIPEKEEGSGELSWRIVEPDSLTWSPDLTEQLNRSEVPLSIKVPPKAKLGCGICKGPDWKPGIFVQFTKENSIARAGGLRPGDQIIQCNNIQFTPEMPFNEAVSIMRGCGVLELVVKKGAGLELFPGESSGYNSSASSVAGDHPASSWEHASTVTNGDHPPTWNHSNNITVDHPPPPWNNTVPQPTKIPNIIQENGTSTAEKRLTSRGDSNSTIIQVTPPLLHNPDSKVAEICMVSQQTETKTTTVLVEVHHSEEDSVSNSQSDASTDRQTSSSMSSFTSSAGSLRCAISQELQRRSKRTPTTPRQQKDKLIKCGLTKEEVHQHEQLMNEFKQAHHKMFPQVPPKEREEEKPTEVTRETRRITEISNKLKSRAEDTSRTRSKKPPPPPPPMPNGVESKQKKGPAPAPPVPSEPPPPPPIDPPSCPTPDYDSLSLASDCPPVCDRVDMQSLESFRLTNPHTGRPKPPDTYFPKAPTEPRANVMVKPLVTVGQYGGDAGKPRVSKLEFLGQPPPTPPPDQPLQLRLASELSHTLARSTLRDKQPIVNGVNHGHVNGKANGHVNGVKGSIIKISVESNKDNGAINGKKPAPFYLFPEGGRRNNTVSFDLTGSEPGRTQTHVHGGILKNSNVSHVQIQPHVQPHGDKALPHKSIKFGPITTVMRDSREPKA